VVQTERSSTLGHFAEIVVRNERFKSRQFRVVNKNRLLWGSGTFLVR